MNEPTQSQLEWARQKLDTCADTLSTKALANALGDKTTAYVLAAIRNGQLAHTVKENGPRIRYSIDKETAIRFLASHYRPSNEEQK